LADLITITIDDKEVEVPAGEMIVESVKRIGEEVPIFCYHPRLKPVGMCRMCLVEVGTKQEDGSVRFFPKPHTACTLPASKGMVIRTISDSLIADRKGVLEFLLINHPLDCPICDKGGECPLQNNTMFYGAGESRYIEVKRHLLKAFPLSKYVCLDLERCIQCGRCTRFTEEISGDGQLSMLFRGADMTPRTFGMTDFDSKFSGNTIEICPVGALTSQEYRFRARPWDLFTAKTICTGCSNGCNIWMDHRLNQLVRINGRTNDMVNDEWTCDKGKFGSNSLRRPDRPSKVLVRDGNDMRESEWTTAYNALISAFTGPTPHQIAGLGGAKGSTEDSYMFQKLFRDTFGSNNIDHRMTQQTVSAERTARRRMADSLPDLERAKSILVFGTQLSEDQPIVFLRVRKAWFVHGARIVVATSGRSDVDSFADVVLRYREGMQSALLGGLLHLLAEGSTADGAAELKASVASMTPEWCEEQTGVGKEALRRAADALKVGASTLYGGEVADETEDALANLALATRGTLNYMVSESGSRGALDMGVLPDLLPGMVAVAGDEGMSTEQILRSAADGKIKALFLNCCDPLVDFPDRALAERALENVDFLAVHHFKEVEANQYASVVLPAQSWADRECAFTNVDGRVQRCSQALSPVGDAKASWRMFAEIALRIRPFMPPFGPEAVMAEIASVVPAYADCTYDKLGEEGVRTNFPIVVPGKLTAVRMKERA